MRHAKFVRLISLTGAFLYNVIYFSFAFEFWKIIEGFQANPEDPTYFEIFAAMTIVYNLIIHLSIIPINTTIILKEFSMEFYQFLGVTKITGTDKDDISLGFHEVLELGLAFLELFNPWWWFSDDPWIYE
jgi:hypothetical protein